MHDVNAPLSGIYLLRSCHVLLVIRINFRALGLRTNTEVERTNGSSFQMSIKRSLPRNTPYPFEIVFANSIYLPYLQD